MLSRASTYLQKDHMDLAHEVATIEYQPLAIHEVESAVVAALEDGAPQVVLNLDSLATLDSEAVRGLITILRRSRDYSGELVLRASRPDTLRTLKIMALDRLFPIISAQEIHT